MLRMLWNLLAVFGCIAVFFALIIAICLAASPKDRGSDDEEQMNYLKDYFNRKDDNND